MKIISPRSGFLNFSVLLLLCFWSSLSYAQSVHNRVNTDSLSIGDTFQLSLTLQLDKEYQKVVFPDTNSFPPSLQLIDRQQFKVSEFSDSLIYNLQYFGNEDLNISPLPITLFAQNDTSIIYSDPFVLYFKTVVAEGDTTLKPMKPNFDFPRPWWPWALLGIALAGFLLWWFKFRESDAENEEEPKTVIEPFYNPLEALEETLVELKKETNIAQDKDFKTFYSEIGDAIRAYFDELYNIPALECTSRELFRYLDAYGVDDMLVEKTRNVLHAADLVKFAKFTPTLDDAWKTYDYVLEFLERAKLADSARISSLRAKYKEQFIINTTPQEQEEA